LLTVGSLYRTAQEKFSGSESWRKDAYDVLRQALVLAQNANDQRAVSYAFGYLGRLYSDEGRYEEALQYTRKAAFAAQQINAYESLYLWEWQIARLLRAQGKTEDAIIAYRQAIGTLEKIRQDLVDGTGSTFAQTVGPVYLELADLLLARSSKLNDQEASRQALLEVRSTLEQVKLAEIEDYLQRSCALPAQESIPLDQLSPGTAIIYPVLLPNRTELLVTLPSGLTQFTSQVGVKQLTEVAREFRKRVDVFTEDQEYLRYAKKLHDWLIQPLESELARQGVDTLVFIPDGVLRSIPMAALHDGKQFLIEKYAIASTLGLTLTSPQPLDRENMEVLLYGITESVQGFPPLPFVGGELNRISELYPAKLFKNEDFTIAAAQKEMSGDRYSIVHIASHAQFDRDPQKSFILTYDDRLTMSQLDQSVGLRRFQDEPLELLVLSACQTAAGDDRSALGLAGIALQAGARSALATLWSVNDAATAVVITEFYRQLQDKNNSKAVALQKAQLMLARNKGTDHPSLWAPFLLIGNWL
jgi:CHAT domain-containing protein